MNAFLILENGRVFSGRSIGEGGEWISEIVFNTSMTGYLEVLTDPSYAGQTVCMTYPLIGNYGICEEDAESEQAVGERLSGKGVVTDPQQFQKPGEYPVLFETLWDTRNRGLGYQSFDQTASGCRNDEWYDYHR